MSIQSLLRGAVVVALGSGFAISSSITSAGERQSEALAVCTAVVKDDSAEVARLLSRHRTSFEYSYSHLAPGGSKLRDARKAYECNGLSLDQFAREMGAQRTAAFLQTGELADGEYVADTSKEASKPNS